MGTWGPGIVKLVPGVTDSIGDEPELLSTVGTVGFGWYGCLENKKAEVYSYGLQGECEHCAGIRSTS